MPSRFHCPSCPLTLRGLLTRRTLWAGLAIAFAVHAASTQLKAAQRRQEAPKPLTTRFVKRQPRLSKPLELKKRPRPKQRQIQRRMVAVKARIGRYGKASALSPSAAVQGLARPKSLVRRHVRADTGKLEPATLAAAIHGEIKTAETVDISTEMVDIDALDTGQFHAMVIQNPNDRKDIRGFFHMAIAYSRTMRNRAWHNFDARKAAAIKRLADTMNRFTNIRTDVTHNVPFDSRELFKIPWVYSATNWAFDVTQSDAQNLGKYMMVGGFFWADSDYQGRSVGYGSLCELIVEALRTQGFEHGKDWRFEDLPSSHPVYHCYFDFDRAPFTEAHGSADTSRWKDLKGVEIEGRVAAMISRLWYWHPWGDWSSPWGDRYDQGLDPTRILQFGVNTIVFALTQEGSITRRVMDTVGY